MHGVIAFAAAGAVLAVVFACLSAPEEASAARAINGAGFVAGNGAIKPINIGAVGDSLTFGSGTSNPPTTSWVGQATAQLQALGYTAKNTNGGYPGSDSWEQIIVTLPTTVAAYDPAYLNVGTVWAGTNNLHIAKIWGVSQQVGVRGWKQDFNASGNLFRNDGAQFRTSATITPPWDTTIGNTTPDNGGVWRCSILSQLLADLETDMAFEAATFRAGRWDKIIAFTVLPCSGTMVAPMTLSNFETNRQAYNTWLRAQTWWDALADVGNDPDFGQPGQSSNSYYQGDGTHLTEAAYAIVASRYIVPAIRAMQ